MNYQWMLSTMGRMRSDIGLRLARAAEWARVAGRRLKAWLDQPVVVPERVKAYDWRGLPRRLQRAAWNIVLTPFYSVGWLVGFWVRLTRGSWRILKAGFLDGRNKKS